MGSLFVFFIWRLVVFSIVRSILDLKENSHKIIALLTSIFFPEITIIIAIIIKVNLKSNPNFLKDLKMSVDKEKNYSKRRNSNYISSEDLKDFDLVENFEGINEEESYSNPNEISSEDFSGFSNYQNESVDSDSFNEEKQNEDIYIEKEVVDVVEGVEDINEQIADNFKSLILNKKLDSYYEPFLSDSNGNLLTKGRYESGKDREFIGRILLSRVDFLNTIEKKFKGMNDEKLIREFEVFNEFDAELESIRRKKEFKLKNQ